MGFRGNFAHAFDDKGRVSVPVRFRDEIRTQGDDRVVITRSISSPCLDVYPNAAWIALEEKFRTTPHFDPRYIRLRRFYFSSAYDCSLDKQGRINVPNDLREYAGIGRDVRFVSDFDRFQLWDPEVWSQSDRDDVQELRNDLAFLAEVGI